MTTKIIADLGLRFPPASRQDEEGRAGLLALLAQDVADVPVSLLEGAAREWVRTKAWMPKAVELRNLSEILRKGVEQQRRAQVPALTKDDGTHRPSPMLTRDELQRMVDARSGTLQADLLEMGLKAGFILVVGTETYREAGGNFTVTKRLPMGRAA